MFCLFPYLNTVREKVKISFGSHQRFWRTSAANAQKNVYFQNLTKSKKKLLVSKFAGFLIRIQSGQWIRIRIRIRNPDTDLGGPK
jgi:hypothetical protein